MSAPPALREALRALIMDALERRYVSSSCLDGIHTENRYQSVVLDDVEHPGVRSPRTIFLDQIDLNGKTVLDLGSNLGELSRHARSRGAGLVDGLEYDPYFVDIARAINLYNDITRVSFECADITDPTTYRTTYDVVFAFSVAVYIKPVLEQVARSTRRILLLETHLLHDNLREDYIDPISEFFPHYAILGETEWGTSYDPAVRRAVIAFARDEVDLLAGVRSPPDEASAWPPTRVRIARVRRPMPEEPRIVEIDVERTDLHRSFFRTLNFSRRQDLISAVERIELDVSLLEKSTDLRRNLADGWMYWLLFLKGYLQYAKTGEIREDNVYYDYLIRHYIEHGHNPGMSADLEEPARASERVARRFRDLKRLLSAHDGDNESPAVIDPLRVTSVGQATEPHYVFHLTGSDEVVRVRAIDGWHRLCSARLAGVRSMRSEVIPEALRDRSALGEIQGATWDGSTLSLKGICWAEEKPYNFEARYLGTTIGQCVATPMSPTTGVEGFGAVFDLHGILAPGGDEVVTVQVIAMQDIVPVGLLEICALWGDLDAGSGEAGDGRANVLEHVLTTCSVYGLLRSVSVHRALTAFGRVSWRGPETPSTRRVLQRFLPGVELHFEEQGEQARPVARGREDQRNLPDLVLMPVAPPPADSEPKARLPEIWDLEPGGYAAVSNWAMSGVASGEPAPMLEVVESSRSAVACCGNVVVLRRPPGP